MAKEPTRVCVKCKKTHLMILASENRNENIQKNRKCPYCGGFDFIKDTFLEEFYPNITKYKEIRQLWQSQEYYEYIDKKIKDYKEKYAEEMSKPIPKPEQNIPRCPTCGCTNIKKLDSFDRGLSVFAWGLASSKIGKQFECLNPKCKYKW